MMHRLADLKVNRAGLEGFKPMLAKVYTRGETVLKWPVIVQPKFDGVRALWDGSQVRSRSGKRTFTAPPEVMEVLVKDFAGVPLDGELYAHGAGFERVVSAARGGTSEVDLQYVVFDMPTSEGFEDRVQHLKEMLWDANRRRYERVVLSPWAMVQTREQLDEQMEHWTAEGYEGVMIRSLGRGYEEYRTDQLLKWKRTHMAAGVVTGVVAGKGRHTGRIGALWVKGASVGWQCKVGTGLSDAERDLPGEWWVGRTVLIEYQELSRYGVPRFPRLGEVVR